MVAFRLSRNKCQALVDPVHPDLCTPWCTLIAVYIDKATDTAHVRAFRFGPAPSSTQLTYLLTYWRSGESQLVFNKKRMRSPLVSRLGTLGSRVDRAWGWWGFFSKQRQILTRQISVHTGNFLEDFRKHGRGGPSSQPLPAQANFRKIFWRIARPEHPLIVILIRLAQSDLGAARRSAASRSWRAFSSAAMRAVASEAARAVALRSSLWAAADSARTDSVLILGVSCVYVCFNVCLTLH
jgi:hypothetical protein